MVEQQPSKLNTRVRFPSPAPMFSGVSRIPARRGNPPSNTGLTERPKPPPIGLEERARSRPGDNPIYSLCVSRADPQAEKAARRAQASHTVRATVASYLRHRTASRRISASSSEFALTLAEKKSSMSTSTNNVFPALKRRGFSLPEADVPARHGECFELR